MAFRNIAVQLSASDAQLLSTLNRAGARVDRFGHQVETSARQANVATTGMGRGFSRLDDIISRGVNRSLSGFVVTATGAYAAGRALNQGIQAIVGGAVQFDARMRNVNSIAHLTEGQLRTLGGEVIDLSKRLPQSANVLAEGLYDIQSSGFAGTGGLIVLNASARAASAGLTDAATASAAVSGTLNAYGLQAKDAQYVSDALFKTVDVGVLSFADLAQGIGQVVGTAAAGKVDIDDLGQAIATMTRGGIIPAEAFTSANQLLAQIIQPGEALAGVFKQLGYESGAAALESKGLYGVMRDIQDVTGGDVTATSELFTDIRSLRGALALGTDQGRLYADVVRSWDAAHQGAGSTAAAFAEQQKSVAFQWQILKNEAQAAAISAGTEVLPTLIDLIHGVETLGHVLANDGVQKMLELAAAAYTLNKAINLGIAIRNSTLVTAVGRQVAGTSASAAAITAEGVAATRTTAQLQALAVAENEAAIAAGRLAVSGSIAGVAGATTNLEGAGVAIGAGMAANLPGRRAIAGAAVRGVAKASVVGLAGLASYELSNSVLHGIFGERFGDDPPKYDDDYVLSKLGPETRKIIDPLIEQYGNLDTALKVLQETNRETAAAQKDLGISHKVTTGNLEEELAALQDLQKARAEFSQQVSTAFFGAVDITQQFDPKAGQQAVDAAQERLLDAQRSLRQQEAQTRAAVADREHGGITVSEEQQLANARRSVADATKDLSDAQRQAAQTGDLGTIYEHNIDMARDFLRNVREAEERGLDPEFIARALKQGPAQAGPVLDAIVADHSNRMIDLANRNEAVLRRIGQQTIRYAQFVNRAVNAPLEDQDRLARELPKALRLDAALRNMPAPATGDWLAEQLGMTPRQIRRLAEDFGVTLPLFVQHTLNHHPVELKVKVPKVPGYISGPTGIFIPKGAATGGLISGPGTGTSDSILLRVSNREYVNRAAAVDYYGVGLFDALNKMQLPRYAEGGYVGTWRPTPTGSSSAKVIVQPVIVRESVTHQTNVGEVRAHDYQDFQRQMRAQQRARLAVQP